MCFNDEYFKGISEFAKTALKNVKELGYVLINEFTGHKVYWHDWEEWNSRSSKFDSTYWETYRAMKDSLSTEEFNLTPIKMEVSKYFKALSKWGRMGLNSPTQGG